MRVADLLPAFDLAAQIWAAQEESADGPDTEPGDLLDAATDTQIDLMNLAAHIPATDANDIAAKETIADRMDRALEGLLTDRGELMTASLRRSIILDRRRSDEGYRFSA